MKDIPNLAFGEAKPKPTCTVELLKACLNFHPDAGFDLTAMRARIRVMDIIEKVRDGGVIKLEDADYKTAQDAIKGTRWTTVQKHLDAFAKQFAC